FFHRHNTTQRLYLFFLLLRRPLLSTLFPYTTLFRSRELVGQPYGIMYVTGPTGSGKTTSLYSALAEINEPGINISTAEDPIEYEDRKSTRLNSSHRTISYAVFCLKKKN